MPFTADAIAAQQVQERLKAIQQLVHDIEKKRQQSEHGLNAISKHQMSQDDKSTPHQVVYLSKNAFASSNYFT